MSLAAGPPAPLSRRAALWLVGVGLVAFPLFLLAVALGPGPSQGEAAAAAHGLSRSAVGYAALVRLLRGDGRTVSVRREARPGENLGLLVLTPPGDVDAKALKDAARGYRVLLVPPKWITVPDPRGGQRVRRVAPTSEPLVEVADAVAPATPKPRWFASLRGGKRMLRLAEPAGRSGLRLPPLDSAPIQRPRTYSGEAWDPVLVDARGDPILLISRTQTLYLLTEPDLLNNAGVADIRTARTAVTLLEALAEDAPIAFDVTLNGLGGRPNPLRELLFGPFAPAALSLLAAAGLLAWLAMGRFGAPPPPERAYAFGKRALADSAASLLAFDRREPRLLPRFAEEVRRQALRALGVRLGDVEAETAALDGAAVAAGAPGWSTLETDAPKTRDALLVRARRLYDWKTEVTGGRG